MKTYPDIFFDYNKTHYTHRMSMLEWLKVNGQNYHCDEIHRIVVAYDRLIESNNRKELLLTPIKNYLNSRLLELWKE